MKLSKIFSKAKDKKELQNLETEFSAKMRVLESVRRQVEHLTDCSVGLKIQLDPKASAQKRSQVITEVMGACGKITKAIDEAGKLDPHRFAAMLMGEQDNFQGIGLLCFSMEFRELEMEICALRARIIALNHKVDIQKICRMDDPAREPDTRLSPVGTAADWEEVVGLIDPLRETGCIHAFAPCGQQEIENRLWVATPLQEIPSDMLLQTLHQNYPVSGHIQMYINEFQPPELPILKELVAVHMTQKEKEKNKRS